MAVLDTLPDPDGALELARNREVLNDIANNELSTEAYPFLADRPLARLGWDPKRISFLPAKPPSDLPWEERIATKDPYKTYPASYRENIPLGRYVPSSTHYDNPNIYMKSAEPWQRKAIERWGLEKDPLNRSYIYSDKDDREEDIGAGTIYPLKNVPLWDQPRTKQLQVAAHESGHAGLQKLLETHPRLVYDLYLNPSYMYKNLNEAVIRLNDLSSYHDTAGSEWLREHFPTDYDNKIKAVKLNYQQPLNELASELLEEQGRPGTLSLNKDFTRLW